MAEDFDLPVSRERRHRLDCEYRFSCRAEECPDNVEYGGSRPGCFVSPRGREVLERDWEDINSITWRQVFTLEEAWVYALLTIVIAVFLFYVIVLVRLLLVS